jgi:hypothetical protein
MASPSGRLLRASRGLPLLIVVDGTARRAGPDRVATSHDVMAWVAGFDPRQSEKVHFRHAPSS